MDNKKVKNTGARKKRKNNNTKMLVTVVAIVILFAVGIGAGVYFYSSSSKQDEPELTEEEAMEAARKGYEEMQDQMVTESDDPMTRKIDFEGLQEINPDVYAWIWVPGTNIDYPILQSETEEDDYYLNTTIDGKQGYPGSIYTENHNAKDFTDPITVVYGHDMLDGTMFTELHKYTDRTFFDNNPYIYIYTPDRTLKYHIFAAVAFDDRYIPDSYLYFRAEEFQRFVDDVRNSIDGNVNGDIDVKQENTALVLSTCISEYPDQRWLVTGTLDEWVVQ